MTKIYNNAHNETVSFNGRTIFPLNVDGKILSAKRVLWMYIGYEKRLLEGKYDDFDNVRTNGRFKHMGPNFILSDLIERLVESGERENLDQAERLIDRFKDRGYSRSWLMSDAERREQDIKSKEKNKKYGE